jgi:pimeloyl-ACP methyl ester carboxylesterase
MQRRFRAHPERPSPSATPLSPEIQAKSWPLVMRVLGPNRDPAWEAKLSDLQVPVLVLFGTRDGVIPPAIGREYKRLIATCSLVYVYNAAHDIQGDRPEAFCEVVADFLQRQEAFVVSRKNSRLFP